MFIDLKKIYIVFVIVLLSLYCVSLCSYFFYLEFLFDSSQDLLAFSACLDLEHLQQQQQQQQQQQEEQDEKEKEKEREREKEKRKKEMFQLLSDMSQFDVGEEDDLLWFVVVVCCLLLVVCCLLFVVCCLLFVVCCLLFVVCCLLFVCSFSLFTHQQQPTTATKAEQMNLNADWKKSL